LHPWSLKDFDGKDTVPLSFTDDNKGVYLSAVVGDGTCGLFLLNLASKKVEILVHDPRVDLSGFIRDVKTRSSSRST
jgi:hypothetical protein